MEGTPARTIRPFLGMWCIALVVLQLFGAWFARPASHVSFDFRGFYAAGYLARSHPGSLYDLAVQKHIQDALISPRKDVLAVYHPSYEALLYAVFSLMKYQAAYLVYIAFTMLVLLSAFFAAWPEFSAFIPVWQPQPGSMFFIYLPVVICAIQGQDSILLLLLYCLAWRYLAAGKDRAAGIILAIALFKFQITLPIALVTAICRGRRFSIGFGASSVGVFLLSILLVGPHAIAELFSILIGATSTNTFEQYRLSVSPLSMPNIAGLFYGLGGRLLTSRVFNVCVGALSLGVLAWCAKAARRREPKLAFAIAILCAVMVSYHFYFYDLAILLLPIAILADRLPQYVLLSLFGTPLIVLELGPNWYFFMAIPLAVTLAYTIFFTPKLADLQRVADKYIDPSKLAIPVVGNEGHYGTPLSALDLGPVHPLDITIPMPTAMRREMNGQGGQ